MQRVRAYFSHSYRPTDREVNEFFWKLCFDEGFNLVVDPKAEVLSITRLERLIQRTNATIAVVPLRSDEDRLRCSPYAVMEYGLAVQAQSPTLAFVEDSVAGRYFSPRAHGTVVFNRNHLAESENEARAALKALHHISVARPRTLRGTLGTVALLGTTTGDSPFDSQTVNAMKRVVERLGFGFHCDNLDAEMPHMLVMRLDSYDAVIVDVRAESIDRWILPFVYARFIPSLRLFHLGTSGELPSDNSFLDVIASQVRLERSGTDQTVLFWRDVAELEGKLESQLLRLRQPPTELIPESDALRYLRSIGRPSSDRRVFISNAHDTHDLALALTRELYLSNVQNFHYRGNNDIPVGDPWLEQLDDRVRRSDIFVAIVSRGFAQSTWCRRELEVARQSGHVQILPYFVDEDVSIEGLTRQGRFLDARSEQSPAIIASDIEGIMKKYPTQASAAKSASVSSLQFDPPIDILILTIKEEEYKAVVETLDNRASVPPTKERPNLYSWEFGTIQRVSGGAPFRIVVGMVGHQGQLPASDAAKESARIWKPTLCLVVGIAGGIPDRSVNLGDVLLSTEVWHFEFGKIGDKFEPSTRRVYQVNSPLLTAAMTLATNHPDWAGKLSTQRPTPGEPKVHAGPIASGDKVVERMDSPLFSPVFEKEQKIVGVEMEGGGAASAIHSLQQQQVGVGESIGFLMIRGVSDVVRTDKSEPLTDEQRSERKHWTVYASKVAAQFTADLIRRRWPFAPR